jgi:hypothetical protein
VCDGKSETVFGNVFDWKQPYRWRTNLRILLPPPLYWLAAKGKDCETVGGTREWYNCDNQTSACYHCEVQREGQLWKASFLDDSM